MNPMKTTPVPLALALAAGCLAASSRASEPPQAPVSLAGTWKLDKSLSDDPARKVMEAMRASGGGERGERPRGEGGGMGGGGGRGGGGGGSMGGGGREGGGGRRPGGRGGSFFGGEPPLDGDAGEDRPSGERAQVQDGRGPMGLAPSQEFMIDQDGDNLAFRTENSLRLLHTDGEKRKKETDAGRLEVVARFVKGALVIESRPEAGGKRREVYSRPSDRTLQVDFEFEGSGPMPGLKFKLVYEAAPAHQF